MVRKHNYATHRAVPDSPDNLADYFDRAFAARTGHQLDDVDSRQVFELYADEAMRRDPGLREQLREQMGGLPPGVRAAVRAGRGRPGNALEGLYDADARAASSTACLPGSVSSPRRSGAAAARPIRSGLFRRASAARCPIPAGS